MMVRNGNAIVVGAENIFLATATALIFPSVCCPTLPTRTIRPPPPPPPPPAGSIRAARSQQCAQYPSHSGARSFKTYKKSNQLLRRRRRRRRQEQQETGPIHAPPPTWITSTKVEEEMEKKKEESDTDVPSRHGRTRAICM
jgi:hypothetical protein